MPTPLSLPKGYQRLDSFPVDSSSVFLTLADLQSYAMSNGTAYAGQICAVNATGKAYVLQSDKTPIEIGSGAAGVASLSDTAPATASPGQLWLKGSTMQVYGFVDGYWVEVGNTYFFGQTATLDDNPPSNPGAGQLWLKGSTMQLYGYVDGYWVEMSNTYTSGTGTGGGAGSVYYDTTIADSVVSTAVGGAAAAPASSWKGKTLVQVLDTILFPTVLASIGASKSVSLSVSGATGVVEVGSMVARVLTASFSRGTIKDGSGSTNANPLVGAASSFIFSGTGISATSQAGSTLAFNAAVVFGTNSWSVSVSHDAGGGAYYDNKGVAGSNLDANRVAGSVFANSSPSITGLYPYYYLKSSSPITPASMVTAIQNGTATKILADSSGTLSIPYPISSQYIAVAYPSSSATKTSYSTSNLDNGPITNVFSPLGAALSVQTSLWTRDYKIHVSSAAQTNTNSTLQLLN